MKRTQLKDTTRNILTQKVSYFSIVVIALLAVMAYLGINFAAKAIRNNANEFYDKTNFRDVQIVSTMLLTEEDLEAVRNVEGVLDAEGVYSTSAKLVNADKLYDVDIVSLTERINVPQVLLGRLPQNANECLLEETIVSDTDINIGAKITLQSAQGGLPDNVRSGEFEVVGIIYHADHAAWKLHAPGNREVVVLTECFDREKLDNCFSKVILTIADGKGYDRFSTTYESRVEPTIERIKKLAAERALIRYEQVHKRYEEEISEGQGKLDAAQLDLEDAKKQLEERRRELISGELSIEINEKKIEEYEKQLAEGKIKLDDAKVKLDDALKKLNDGEDKIKPAKTQLDDAGRQLSAAKKKIDKGRKDLQNGYKKIEDAKGTIRDGLYKAVKAVLGKYADRIDWGKKSYTINIDDPKSTATKLVLTKGITIDLKKSMGDNIFAVISSIGLSEDQLREIYKEVTGKVTEIADKNKLVRLIVDLVVEEYKHYDSQYNQLAAAAKEWDKGHDQYIDGLKTYNSRKKEYDSALKKYNAARKELDNNWKSYRLGLDEYNDGMKEYLKGLETISSAKAEIERGKAAVESGKNQLEEGQNKYNEGLQEFNEGRSKLDKAKIDLETLDKCRWITLGVEGNPSFLVITNCQKNCGDMGATFALVFVLVGALVIFATVGRIVEEQRPFIGTTKALGLLNSEIFAKYLSFGVSATFIGMILGFVAGYFGIQKIMLYVYGRYFVFDCKSAIIVSLTAIVFVAGIILSGLTVWFACSNLMKAPATELLKPKTPSVKRRAARSSKGKGSLYSRLILLNMLNDLKRVIVTIISIAGCCTLLVAGFSMKYGIRDAIDQQFTEIDVYDEKIVFDPDVSSVAQEEIATVLKDTGTVYTEISARAQAYAKADGNNLSNIELICGNISDINSFIVRRDMDTYQPITGDGDGVWITRKTSEILGVDKGDLITLYSASMKPYLVPVAGVFEIFGGRYMIMSSENYARYFGSEPEVNAFFVNYNGADAEALKTQIDGIEGVKSQDVIAEQLKVYQSYTKVLDFIAVLFIVIAGTMAYFILLNLISMYINQKKRELTTMRINGFTVGEVKRYVSLEFIISTVLGIIAGCLAGSALSYRIIKLIEGANLHFICDIQPLTWLYAAIITSAFAAGICMLAFRKIKYLKLVDINS